MKDKKRGGWKVTEAWLEQQQAPRLNMRVPPDFYKLVDEWRRQQPDLPNRSEAIRRLVDLGLEAKPPK